MGSAGAYGKARMAGEKGMLLFCHGCDAGCAGEDGRGFRPHFAGNVQPHSLKRARDSAGRTPCVIGVDPLKARNRLSPAIKRVLLFLEDEKGRP